jgi:hypothetical protein
VKAVLWPYKFADMKADWRIPMLWVVGALQRHGVEVRRHPDFKCAGLEGLPLYDHRTDNPCDIAIYNHSDDSELVGKVLKARVSWHFKPTGPTPAHTTLDALGYGPFSSIGYECPPYRDVPLEEVKRFYETQVAGWVKARATKWGDRFKFENTGPAEKDYHLVLGQCGGDSVVTRMDFGDYWLRMQQVIREILRVDTVRPVVVKLHPYTDGTAAKDTRFSDRKAQWLRALDPRVRVYTGKANIHAFIQGARDVFLANSGSGFEAMMHVRPIIAWGHPEYHWIAYDLRLLADVRYSLHLDRWWCPECEAQFLTWYYTRYCFSDAEGAERRVKELLAQVPGQPKPAEPVAVEGAPC